MSIIKLAGKYFSYRKVDKNERNGLLNQHKHWEGLNTGLTAGSFGALGAMAGGYGGSGTGALLGAGLGGGLGYLVSKTENETREDRLKNPDRKWIIYEPGLRKAVKKYGR